MTVRTIAQLRADAFHYSAEASAAGYDAYVFRYRVAMDNYEPTRLVVTGYAVRYSGQLRGTDHATAGIYFPCDDANGIPLANARNATALFDSGRSVEAYYCAGWNPYDTEARRDPAKHFGASGPYVLWHPFPLSEGIRPDNGRPVDMSGWMIGPRRAYHFKTETECLVNKCNTVGCLNVATEKITYGYRGQAETDTDFVCTGCADSYARRTVLVNFSRASLR